MSLVAILDADKEGFLRAETSLIQTIGRAARNASGKVIMYADTVTGSMDRAIKETNRRRKIQDEYNKANGIVPKTIIKGVRDVIEISTSDEAKNKKNKRGQKSADAPKKLTRADREAMIEQYTAEMKRAAKQLDFERAAMLRDKIKILKDEM